MCRGSKDVPIFRYLYTSKRKGRKRLPSLVGKLTHLLLEWGVVGGGGVGMGLAVLGLKGFLNIYRHIYTQSAVSLPFFVGNLTHLFSGQPDS